MNIILQYSNRFFGLKAQSSSDEVQEARFYNKKVQKSSFFPSIFIKKDFFSKNYAKTIYFTPLMISGRILSIFCTIVLALSACTIDTVEENSAYLPLDDSEYPYAGLDRIVIETEHFKQIKDAETKIPARMQIYGETSPKTQIMDLTLKGHGNTSFDMSKFSYKIDLMEKASLFGMDDNKDWVLIANHKDKSLMQNYITYQLAKALGDEYSSSCKYAELYINRQYLGVYNLCEHVKVGKHRVNIPKTDSCYLFEKVLETDLKSNMFESLMEHSFEIRYPKNPTPEMVAKLNDHIDEFELKMRTYKLKENRLLGQWIDIQDIIRYYWINEFSKNADGAFTKSIFFTWCEGGLIQMGPVWDFDIAYISQKSNSVTAYDWYIRKYGWYEVLHRNSEFRQAVKDYWIENRETFRSILDTIDVTAKKLQKATKNEFKRWPILQVDDKWPFIKSYDSYDNVVTSLKLWIEQRMEWINKNL